MEKGIGKEMTYPELAEFPVVTVEAVSWGDMDSFQHVSNIVYFEYFQNARIEYMTRLGWFDMVKSEGLGPIVASTQARFRKPVEYPDTLHIGARIISIGADRVTFEHRVVSEKWATTACEGECVIVSMDYRAKAKCSLPESIRRAIAQLENHELG